ncbi:uracil-DNA glycosylase [Microbacterium sp. BH-3-3-3]|uniref:uracil-DNA glycosylase n=1 Tax=Microbacterium sp. BH-3-3-3 TaxID=1906742 RepID=UPI0015E16F97|nr:uracil-DNA glycosylase [Microbacterium sp. BH-3-3-3]
MALPSTHTATNFWLDDSDLSGDFPTTASERRAQLDTHLNRVRGGGIVLVGEAAGWRGARQSGVAFTSAVTVGLPGTREPTATTVHRALAELGLKDSALLWNAFPLHPHEVRRPGTNRTPTPAELRSGRDALALAVDNRRVVCVGKKAAESVRELLGVPTPAAADVRASDRAVAIRHPANGGTPHFFLHMRTLATRWGL